MAVEVLDADITRLEVDAIAYAATDGVGIGLGVMALLDLRRVVAQ